MSLLLQDQGKFNSALVSLFMSGLSTGISKLDFDFKLEWMQASDGQFTFTKRS